MNEAEERVVVAALEWARRVAAPAHTGDPQWPIRRHEAIYRAETSLLDAVAAYLETPSVKDRLKRLAREEVGA